MKQHMNNGKKIIRKSKLYLQDSTRAVIGQFYGPYSTVRPAKFESSPDAISFVYQNLLQRKF